MGNVSSPSSQPRALPPLPRAARLYFREAPFRAPMPKRMSMSWGHPDYTMYLAADGVVTYRFRAAGNQVQRKQGTWDASETTLTVDDKTYVFDAQYVTKGGHPLVVLDLTLACVAVEIDGRANTRRNVLFVDPDVASGNCEPTPVGFASWHEAFDDWVAHA